MPILAQRCQVAIKAEAVPGVPETLAAADVILTTELPTWEPDIQITERAALTKSLDQRGHVVGARAAKINFKMYQRGTESVAVDPTNLSDCHRPLRAAGFQVEVISGAQVYTLNSAILQDTGAYFTVGIFIDGKLYQIHGAVADVTMVYEIGKPVLLEFAFTGVYGDPIDTDLLDPDYTSVVEPPFLSAAFTVLGFPTAKLKTMTVKIGNQITLRPDPNDAAGSGYVTAQITARKMTGSFDPEETFVADKDWFAEYLSGATGAIDTGVFPSNGDPYNQHRLEMPAIQYHGVKTADRNGILTAPIDFAIKAASDPGDDSITLTIQ